MVRILLYISYPVNFELISRTYCTKCAINAIESVLKIAESNRFNCQRITIKK